MIVLADYDVLRDAITNARLADGTSPPPLLSRTESDREAGGRDSRTPRPPPMLRSEQQADRSR